MKLTLCLDLHFYFLCALTLGCRFWKLIFKSSRPLCLVSLFYDESSRISRVRDGIEKLCTLCNRLVQRLCIVWFIEGCVQSEQKIGSCNKDAIKWNWNKLMGCGGCERKVYNQHLKLKSFLQHFELNYQTIQPQTLENFLEPNPTTSSFKGRLS